MTRESHFTQSQIPDVRVENLAGCVLAELAANSLGKQGKLGRSEVVDLFEALSEPDDTTYQQRLLSAIAGGTSPNDLIDLIIPDLAQRLGQDWLADKLNFAQVTIALSRLQQTVRHFGVHNEVGGLKLPSGHRVLLMLPESEQHSLAIFIIANQMRRLGIWVQLALDCKPNQMNSLIEDQNFTMIGISLGAKQSLDQVHKLTNSIRQNGATVPIILGGAALDKYPDGTASDFGADFIAQSTHEALHFCQINPAPMTVFPLEYVKP